MTSPTDMHAFCEAWLRQTGARDTQAFQTWLDELVPLRIARGEMLVSAGSVDTRIFLIRSGLVRLFYLSVDGKERNKAFYTEGALVGAMSSVIRDGQAPFSIEALEDTEVYSGDYATFFARAGSNPDRSRVILKLLSDAFVRNEQREAVLLTGTAEQRYQWLVAQEPWLLDRVPQFHLATYLGMEAVTLSRLKGSA
ncbi:MAG: Crp/Fnr family transcriptional regulator [Pseudomonadota bacterium]